MNFHNPVLVTGTLILYGVAILIDLVKLNEYFRLPVKVMCLEILFEAGDNLILVQTSMKPKEELQVVIEP